MGIPKCYSRVSNNRTASIKLAKQDNLLLLNKFKAFSINLNAKYIIGITPFHNACKVGQFDVVHQIGF